ncbi:MAG: hypothetical protein L0H93_01945 [Nocardioides sp.]|nr:hypothetical protein [Nocardioides sp.]
MRLQDFSQARRPRGDDTADSVEALIGDRLKNAPDIEHGGGTTWLEGDQ